MALGGYLGIDAGTQGLSVVFTDESMQVVAKAEADYAMVPDLAEGCYEQLPSDWESALGTASKRLREKLATEMEVYAVGISGQMHGEVLTDESGDALIPARLWCDSRNDGEGAELTAALETKMPKRITSARWLWTLRNRPEVAAQVKHMTTPAGWISHRLTGSWNLGIGDASGMFPIDQATLTYDTSLLAKYHEIAESTDVEVAPLERLLPPVRCAGQDGGALNEQGAHLLGLQAGIPVAPAEGDQPAAMVGSLISAAGTVSMSFGTSVCANSVGDRAFAGVCESVDHFCAVDGKPINMVCLRNGTTFMNTIVEMFGLASEADRIDSFGKLMPLVLDASPDCGGLLALPFMDDEPGLDVQRGGTAMIIGLNPDNAKPGNVAKAALLSTMFNLRLGSEPMDAQRFPRSEIILSGGLTKTPQLGQVLADIFSTPVRLLTSADEGTAWGAALLAKFRHLGIKGSADDWGSFLADHDSHDGKRFEPDAKASSIYEKMYQRYRDLVAVNPSLNAAVC